MYCVDLLESVLYEGPGDGVEDDQQYTRTEQLESVNLLYDPLSFLLLPPNPTQSISNRSVIHSQIPEAHAQAHQPHSHSLSLTRSPIHSLASGTQSHMPHHQPSFPPLDKKRKRKKKKKKERKRKNPFPPTNPPPPTSPFATPRPQPLRHFELTEPNHSHTPPFCTLLE